MIERPGPLTGTPEERIDALHAYLCRLADTLSATDTVEQVLSADCGTGVPLREQFKAMKNIYGGNKDG